MLLVGGRKPMRSLAVLALGGASSPSRACACCSTADWTGPLQRRVSLAFIRLSQEPLGAYLACFLDLLKVAQVLRPELDPRRVPSQHSRSFNTGSAACSSAAIEEGERKRRERGVNTETG